MRTTIENKTRARARAWIVALAMPVLASGFSEARAARPTTRAEAAPSDDKLTLAFPGVEGPIPYESFGSFENVGTDKFRFVISDKKGLGDAAGEGIFPYAPLQKDPQFKKLQQSGALQGNHWSFVDTNTAAKNFYRWASTNEEPGVKQFFTAVMLERAGLFDQAVKAFYAAALHFPKSISYTYYDTPWYVAPAALDRVEQLLRHHPELGMAYVPGRIRIHNKYDTDTKNDSFEIDPGKLVDAKKVKKEKPMNVAKEKAEKTVGGPRTQLKKFKNGHWAFFVDGKQFPLKTVTYSVTPVGMSPDRGTWNVSKDWQLVDTNKNGRHDGFDEAFVDANGNNTRDPDEPEVGDGELLRRLGANTIRAYHHLYNKELFRRLHKDYGIYVLAGDLLGGYATGSGASWTDGTDYTNPQQQENMLESVRSMVREYKDEPYVVMWVLGNENVYGVASNAGKEPRAFFQMVNRAAKAIKELDPTRPVAIANGDILFMDIFKQECPDVDVFGANVYRGEQGFGRTFFTDVKEMLDRPAMITEYGASAYAEGYTKEQAEAYHAMYVANNWEDLEANMAGHGVGNALGGVLFEYMDEWWKANADLPEKVQKQRAAWYAPKSATYKNLQPENQDLVPQFGLPFLDGWSYEEWFGLIGQGDGQASPFLRHLRPAYHTMSEMWGEKKKK